MANVINLLSNNNANNLRVGGVVVQRAESSNPLSGSNSNNANNVSQRGSGWLRVKFGPKRLLPHQINVSRLFAQTGHPGLLLYYKVGSGKTLASIAACENLAIREMNRREVVLLVPPAIQDTFEKELRACLRPDQRKRYKFMSPQVMHSKVTQNVERAMDLFRGKVLVVDEAHNFRTYDEKEGMNAKGKWLRSLFAVSKVAHKRLLLTGTPIVNYPRDLGPLLAIVDPNSDMAEPLMEFDKTHGVNGRGDTATLRRALKCKSLYYAPSPAEIQRDYPTVTEQYVKVPMGPAQMEQQFKLAESMVKAMNELDPNANASYESSSFLTKPREVNLMYLNEHPKISRCVEHIIATHTRNPSAKFLVYSFFVQKGLNKIARMLGDLHIPYLMFNGDMKKPQREEAVSQYNRGDVRILLISKAGKEGLDLKGTSEIHVLEPDWNEENISQVIGRGVRSGSHRGLPPLRRVVAVYRYVAYLPRGHARNRLLGRLGVDTGRHPRNRLYEQSADEILAETSKRKHVRNTKFVNEVLIPLSRQNLVQCIERNDLALHRSNEVGPHLNFNHQRNVEPLLQALLATEGQSGRGNRGGRHQNPAAAAAAAAAAGRGWQQLPRGRTDQHERQRSQQRSRERSPRRSNAPNLNELRLRRIQRFAPPPATEFINLTRNNSPRPNYPQMQQRFA
jgi:superfamily II DNA/RNA helicase